MSDLVQVMNAKTYSNVTNVNRTFRIKSANGEAGKVLWLKTSDGGGTTPTSSYLKYIPSGLGSNHNFYIYPSPDATMSFEFGFAPWSTRTSVQEMLIDDGDYIEFNFVGGNNTGFTISLYLVNCTWAEV